jgi:hypothetical protein
VTTPAGGGVRMPSSTDLATLSNQLTTSGDAVWKSLELESDAPLWNSPEVYADYFGPATDIAKDYASLTHRFKALVADSVAALRHGGDAFTEAARLFADAERRNEERLRGEGPR